MKSVLKNFAVMVMTVAMVSCGSSSGGDDDKTDNNPQSSGYVAPAGSYNPATAAKVSEVQLDIMGSGVSGLALTAGSVDVVGPDGIVQGTLSLTRADIVLKDIELEFLEPEGDDEIVEDSADDAVERDDSAGEVALALTEDEAGDQESEGEGEESENSAEDDPESASLDELKYKGPYVVDLLTNTTSPALETKIMPEALVKKLKMKLDKLEEEDLTSLGKDETDALAKRSIYIAGTYTPVGGTAVSFEMGYELDEEFEVENKAGFVLDPNALNSLIVAFRIDDWFRFDGAEKEKGVSFADIGDADIALVEDGDEEAKQVRELIKENIKDSAESGKDEDGDGELAADEVGDDTDDEEDVEASEEASES